MNKQEAIEKIYTASWDDFNYKGLIVDVETVNKIIYQIAEPKKVVVPKFVAEWIEAHKGDYNKWDEEAKADFVFRSINDLFRFGEGFSPWDFTIDEKFSEWTTKNAYKFITAILFGYEIEQEKLYTVEIAEAILTKITRGSNIQYKMLPFGNVTDVFDKAIYTTRLTEQEIKQKDERLWQFAKEVE